MKKAQRSKSKKSPVPGKGKPDLAAFMSKIEQRLEGLEKKVDQLIDRTASGVAGETPVAKISAAPEQEALKAASAMPKPVNGQRERALYQAVCADCRKDCEVPFRPAGDRPVYCKECYAQRKTNGNPQANTGRNPPAGQQRIIRVTPNGVGRVTVSEINLSSARHGHPGRKSHGMQHKRYGTQGGRHQARGMRREMRP